MKYLKKESNFSINNMKHIDLSKHNKLLRILLTYNLNIFIIGKNKLPILNFNSFNYIINNKKALKNLLIAIIVSFLYWIINYSCLY